MLWCYITDRRQFPGTEAAQVERLLTKMEEAARSGVNFIQLRERDLCARQLEILARRAVDAIGRGNKHRSTNYTDAKEPEPAKLLINSRIDVALATGADGVHLRSDDPAAGTARAIWDKGLGSRNGEAPADNRSLIAGVSCHTAQEVRLAASHAADFAVFGPVFGKRVDFGDSAVPSEQFVPGVGLKKLAEACGAAAAFRMPVLALGGVSLQNAADCAAAGAAGIAAIRLFQEHDIAEVLSRVQ